MICILESARHELLSRKYFKRWNSIYWRKKLNRNATSRRQSLAQSIRRESQRRTRGDAELEAILEAQKQKVRIQAEQLRRSQEDPNPQVPVSEVGQRPKSLLLAGRKRKSLHGDELHPITNGNGGRKVAKRHAHRRSKTMDGLRSISKANSPAQVDAAPASPRMKSSTLSGVSILQDRNASSIPLQFTRGRKTDSTHTDYFRLKALGIDPDTPIFPDTKNSLDRKRRRQEELSQPTPKKRASTLSSPNAHKSDQHELSSTSQTQASRSITAPETSLPDPRTTQQESKDDLLEDDDEFLRQIREIQAAMSEDTEWFQRHAALIEKGVEQQEEFRESLSQRSSTNSSAVATPNSKTGLARVNGYDYAPFTSRSGSQFSLSRTEKRIRVTGARGLATKSVSDYLAVPMSKSSRAALQELDKVHDDREPNPPKKRKAKTKQGEKDSKYIYESDEEDKEEALEMEMSSHVHNHKQQHLSKRRIETYKSHLQADNEGDENGWDRDYHIDTLHQVTVNHDTSSAFDEEVYDEEEEDVSGEGIEEDEEYIQEGLDGEGDEGDDGEDEAEYDEDDDSVLNENHLVEAGSTTLPSLRGSKINPFHMRLRSATPEAQASSGGEYALGGTQMSRATSGTGVSADDALVLSD